MKTLKHTLLRTALTAVLFPLILVAASAQTQVRSRLGDSLAPAATFANGSSQTPASAEERAPATKGLGHWYPLPAAVPRTAEENGAPPEIAVRGAGDASLSIRLTFGDVVSLRLYDALGRDVCSLAEGPFDVGTTSVPLEAGTLSPGHYIVRASSGSWHGEIRLLLVR